MSKARISGVDRYKRNQNRSREAGTEDFEAGIAAHHVEIAEEDIDEGTSSPETDFRQQTCVQSYQCEFDCDEVTALEASALLQNISNGYEPSEQGNSNITTSPSFDPSGSDDAAGVGSNAGPGGSNGNAESQATGERRQEAPSAGSSGAGGSRSYRRRRSSGRDDHEGPRKHATSKSQRKSAWTSLAKSRQDEAKRIKDEAEAKTKAIDQAEERSIRLKSRSHTKKKARIADELVETLDLANAELLRLQKELLKASGKQAEERDGR